MPVFLAKMLHDELSLEFMLRNTSSSYQTKFELSIYKTEL